MHDAGRDVKPMTAESDIKSPEKVYPTLSVDCCQAPFLKAKKVGDMVQMLVHGKIVSDHMGGMEGEDHRHFQVKIKKLGVKE